MVNDSRIMVKLSEEELGRLVSTYCNDLDTHASIIRRVLIGHVDKFFKKESKVMGIV